MYRVKINDRIFTLNEAELEKAILAAGHRHIEVLDVI